MTKNKKIKVSDTGIFQRTSESYSLSFGEVNSDFDITDFEEFSAKFHNVISYQYDLKARLKALKKLSSLALKEEGYENISHFGDIESILLTTRKPGQELHDVVDRMTPRARTAREIFRRLLEMENLSVEESSTILLDLGQLHIRLLLTEYVELKFKKHKDAPKGGGEARARNFSSVKAAIFKENKKLKQTMSQKSRSRIIYERLRKNDKFPDITPSKIEGHLRRANK